MAKETLSIELDSGLVERVRRYGEEHGTGVSETIGELIASLLPGEAGDAPAHFGSNAAEEDLPPITRSLYGIASSDVDVEDYRDHLWRKHMG
jgi:hypothetical protein